MTQQILLGPQTPIANIRGVVDKMSFDGPIVAITAGWRDSEGEIDELQAEIGRPVENLMIYQRAEKVFANEPDLRAIKRERQDKLQELQRLYRIRLAPAMSAVRRLMRTRCEPELLRLEVNAATAQVRALDRHHLRRIVAVHRDFDSRRAVIDVPMAVTEREAVQAQLSRAGLIIIAGGHVAVLLNRIRLFQLGPLMAQKPLIAWSAGAMALTDRIVLFHHKMPQGKRDAEVLDRGLGIARGLLVLPHSRARLDRSNRKRMALFGRRFSPAACCTLDNGSVIELKNGRAIASTRASVITPTGRLEAMVAP
jgi:peptidase E